ncbi:hypothetical protein [Terriglobus roseus]|nr:hypothetical protein [Terriglobus roseus]
MSARRVLRYTGLALSAACALGLTGCVKNGGGSGGSGSTGGSGGSGTTPADYIYLSHNWSLTATPTKGGSTTPYTVSGVIDEQPGSNASHYVTSVLQIGSPCYDGANIVPADGSVNGARIQTSSFDVAGQVMSLDAQKDSTATHLTGVYTISGGCANGEAGTISGQAYAALSGTYVGSVAGQPGETITLNVNQELLGTGVGTFVVSGTARFSGISCFTQGTLGVTNAYVRGGAVVLQFATNEPQGSQVSLNGTIDAAAKTFNVTSGAVTGGACAASLGNIALTKQ